MTKRMFSIAFKNEVVAFMETGKTAYAAAKYFSMRDKTEYSNTVFQQWFKKKERIKQQQPHMKRISGAGRKTSLGVLEEIIADEVIELRIMKIKVTRTFISERAIQLAQENNIELKATGPWLDGFMSRNNFSLRRTTNFTLLTDDILLSRAVSYMKFLRKHIRLISLSKTLLMDETAVYFEDNRTQTIDIKGRKHIIMKTTGFSSMRVTVMLSMWADGRKSKPVVLYKGKQTNDFKINGNIYSVAQDKAWVNQEILIKWINLMFPSVDYSEGKCIVWDSCRAHISETVKNHCMKRNIKLIVIPGGLTAYLQAGDIGVNKEFKDKVFEMINQWKNSDLVQYTRGGNPRRPAQDIVNSWVSRAWDELSINNIRRSINAAGFSANCLEWHISKHDVYGERFVKKYLSESQKETDHSDSEEILTDDAFIIYDE
jgi:DDE superfamily endonuclease